MAASKIQKEKGAAEPSPFELEVAQALSDLEANSADLKAELRELFIVAAKEVDVQGRKAVVIFVPFRLLKLTHKIQSRLVRELEKKFSGRHVVLIAQRRIQRKETKAGRMLAQKRPRSRTLTAVHDAILEDLVYPTEIVGKHMRYKTDGTKLLKMCAAHRARAAPGPRRAGACTRASGRALTRAATLARCLRAQLPQPEGGRERRVQAGNFRHCVQAADRKGRGLRVPHHELSVCAVGCARGSRCRRAGQAPSICAG